MNLPGYRLLIPMLLATGLVDAQQTRNNPPSVTETVQAQVDRLAEMVNREQAALESSQRARGAAPPGCRIARTIG